ncbi:MAG TPA: NUDIX hydrolase [Burkholderiales bacterium]|jgi:8-oxo-dGTP pyrophosphatase MutT (NUDIX family)|nr:NUDIX hydrolase [Burkholderiales bacterium]
MVWKPAATVAAVIERGGRFLIVEERIDGLHVLNQPAGHLDPGESLLQACRREVLEETAHRFTPEALVGIYRWHYVERDVTFLRFCFRGRVDGVENRGLDREIVRLHWLTRDELLARRAEHRSPLVQRCVDDFVSGRQFPLEVLSREYA